MKKTYIISFFLALLVLDICALFAYFYITRNLSSQNESITKVSEETPGTAIFTNRGEKDIVTRDTEYILEKYNAADYTMKELSLDVPVEMLGLNREELCDYIDGYQSSPTLEDINDGFLKVELLSFSKDKIIIRKYYEGAATETLQQEPEYYILLVERNFVVVYENDYEHLYMHTDICVEELPQELQQELIDGKVIYGTKELYDFLEAYSS